MEEVNQAVQAASAGGAAYSGGKAAGFGAAKAMLASSAIGGVLIAAMSISFATPKSPKEIFLSLVSMFAFALCGSSFVIFYFHMALPNDFNGHLIRLGIAALCGAPGWLIVRASFQWMETMQGKDIGEIIKTVKGWFS